MRFPQPPPFSYNSFGLVRTRCFGNSHFATIVPVSKDISHALAGWPFDPERMNVRIVQGDNGREKIQVRLDLGVLQIDFDGRPDGERVGEFESWFDHYLARQQAHDLANPDGPTLLLEPEDCLRLLREGVQYYHRYLSFWSLERYELCARDTARNLKVFAFVREYARNDRDKLQFDQWRPYVTMMHTRAVATPLVELRDYAAAIGAVDAGIEAIRQFLIDYEQLHRAEDCGELQQLIHWREEIVARQAGVPRLNTTVRTVETIRAELDSAIAEERFEDAARLRDEIRSASGGVTPNPGQM